MKVINTTVRLNQEILPTTEMHEDEREYGGPKPATHKKNLEELRKRAEQGLPMFEDDDERSS